MKIVQVHGYIYGGTSVPDGLLCRYITDRLLHTLEACTNSTYAGLGAYKSSLGISVHLYRPCLGVIA